MKQILKSAQPWELELAEKICSENLQILKEEFYGVDKPDTRFVEQFYQTRDRMMADTVGIVREVQVDSNGQRILTPDEWLEKTRDMDENELKKFADSMITTSITDVRRDYTYQVPASLAGNFARLFEVGIRQAVACSGRLADHPNHRDKRGFPLMFSGVGRPLSFLTFDIRSERGLLNVLNRSQMQDVTWGAREAGWKVENYGGKFLSVMLPLTKSGLTSEEVSEKALDKLWEQDPEYRSRPDWQAAYVREFKNIVCNEGGRIMYTDKDLADAWDRLTEAIVNNVRKRWQRENPRVSDIQVNRLVDRNKLSVEHTIRCRIDGQQQMSVPLHPLDGGRYDKAVHVGDAQKINELKRELAGTYFSDELRIDRSQNQGFKR